MFTIESADEPEDDGDDNAVRHEKDASVLLGRAALAAAMTPKMVNRLKRPPAVTIVVVPHVDWIPVMNRAIRGMEDAPVLRNVSERAKAGTELRRIGQEELRWLQVGKSVLFITHNPVDLLHEAVLAGADVIVTVPALAPHILRRVIRQLTGGVARHVTEAMAELDLTTLISQLRPGLSAGQCVANLRRALERKTTAPAMLAKTVPLINALPLQRNVRLWADQTLTDLAAVTTGTLPPDGVVAAVLEGPPGTGKTLIAESLAQSSGWAFVPTSVGSWFATSDGALGGVSRMIRRFFETVMSQTPAIGFLDELDAIPDRASMDKRNLDWWTPVVTLILTEIDNVRKSGRPVLLLGATNYYNRLDSALVRPGRLQRRVPVLPPQSEEEVIAVLRHYLGDELKSADFCQIGRLGQGATPARIEGWVKEARAVARLAKRPLAMADILAEILPPEERSAEDLRTVAIHEIGHALVAHRLGLKVESVSIIPEGASAGQALVHKATRLPTWEEVATLVTVALGGRAADIVVGDGANAGAESDLAEATRLLLAAHETQGLCGGLVSRHVLVTAGRSELQKTIATQLHQRLQHAMAIISAERPLVLKLAAWLLQERVLSSRQWEAALADKSGPEMGLVGSGERMHEGPDQNARLA